MSSHQKIVALVFSVGLLVLIIELVRRKKLREEYSFLWILTSIFIFLLVIWGKLLKLVMNLLSAKAPASTVFFCGIFFIVLISLHFSVKISHLTNQVKDLTQKLALLEKLLEEKK